MHTMSPTAIFALLLMALVIDWMSIGPDSIRDRVAFLLGLPAIRAGWDGSPVDRWTVDMASTWIDQIKASGNATLAQAATAQILGVLVGALAIYCIGVLAPVKWSSKLGRFATLSFRKGGGAAGGGVVGRTGGGSGLRLNARLWVCAYLLGIMAELPAGLVGELIEGAVDGLTGIVAPLPNTLFGVG